MNPAWITERSPSARLSSSSSESSLSLRFSSSSWVLEVSGAVFLGCPRGRGPPKGPRDPTVYPSANAAAAAHDDARTRIDLSNHELQLCLSALTQCRRGRRHFVIGGNCRGSFVTFCLRWASIITALYTSNLLPYTSNLLPLWTVTSIVEGPIDSYIRCTHRL